MEVLPPGGLADVWTQLCLGEILRQERPLRFEQHGAPPAFASLDALASAPIPARALARAARGSPSLAATRYAGALRRELAREPARLVGSPGLALAVLGPSGASFDFAAVDHGARDSILAAAEALAPAAAVRCWFPGGPQRVGDVPPSAHARLEVLAPIVPAPDRSPAFLAPFLAAARGGRSVLQAIAYGAPLAPAAPRVRDALDLRLRALAAELPPTAFWCGELRPADPDPDAAGCALLAAGLSPPSLATCRELAIRLAHVLASDAETRVAFGTLAYLER